MTGGSHSRGPPVSGSRWERAARGRAGAGLRRGLGGPRCWAKPKWGRRARAKALAGQGWASSEEWAEREEGKKKKKTFLFI